LLLWHHEKWKTRAILFGCRIARGLVELGASLKPGEDLAKGFLYPACGQCHQSSVAGPEEALEAILAMARHEVDMDVGDTLTDVIVDGDECSIGL